MAVFVYSAMRAPRLLFIFLVLTICPVVEAQDYRAIARRYGIEDGLPHRDVYSIIQDSRGFIWAATLGGAARFDGRRFQVFNKSESGLSGDIVSWLAEDTDGYIWACRPGPSPWLDIIDPVSGKVTPAADFLSHGPPPASLENWLFIPVKTTDGTLVFNDPIAGSLFFYHPKTGWKQSKIAGSSFFFVLKVTGRQTIWGIHTDSSSHQALIETDFQGKTLRSIPARPGGFFWYKKGTTTDPDGFFVLERLPERAPVLWEIDGNGNRTTVSMHNKYEYAHQHARIAAGRIEVQFPYIMDRQGRVLLDITEQYPDIDPLQFHDYLLDRNGNVWFATTFGLIVVEIRKNHFRRLLHDEKASGGRGIACRGLLEIGGKLTVNAEAYGEGRYFVDPKTGAFERLPGKSALGISPSADGNVWTHINIPTDGWLHLSIQKTTPAGQPIGPGLLKKRYRGEVWAILEENPQRMLLGHYDGVTVYNPQTGYTEPWRDESVPEFDKATVNHLQRDRSGRIWACTHQGLFSLRPGGGVERRYWSGGKGDTWLPYDHINHFYEDNAGIFWLSTGGGGLIRWDQKAPVGKQTQVFFRKNGLLNGTVYAAYEDRHGHLWLPTDYGIVQFDKKNLQVRHTWLEADGITNNEFNRISHCRGADGTLYFGGLNGVTAFHPDDFYSAADAEESHIPLVISSFGVLDAGSGQLENRLAEILQNKTFTLHPGDRYLQLEFALLDYVAPEKVTYTWKLEGVSADWENLREPELRLSSLPYGTHRLRVRAQASDGAPAANELSLELTVLPPVYLRGWFLLLAAVLLAAGIRGWLYWRTREHRLEQERLEAEVERQTATIRRQTEELKKLDQAKSRFFANVSHELRTPLTLLLGPLSSILKANRLEKKDRDFAQTAQEHGKQLLQLVNEILDLSKIESGKMHLQETTVSLQPFLRRVAGAFESHAERLGILFVFEYKVAERLRVLVDEDKLQKVLNNLLANAIKFTPPHAGGKVGVRVVETDGYLRLTVYDTGRGIHPDDLPHVFERFYQTSQTNAPIEGGTGIGLALCREFAELMHGRISVESTLGSGSTFHFDFPKKEVLGVNNDKLLMLKGESEMLNAEHDSTQDSSFIPDKSGQAIHHLSLKNHSSFKKTILLVEDNDSLRNYVSSILSEKYHVVTAEHGQAALSMMNNEFLMMNADRDSTQDSSFIPDKSGQAIHHLSLKNHSSFIIPHLIISDIMMPVMDGFQLLENLKGDDRWRHIPMVMLTARADLRDKLRALRIGVDDYILKPFEEEELLVRVENLLTNYDARESTSQPVNQSTNQPVNQSISQPITAEDQTWLETCEQQVEQHLGDFNLTAETLADALAMSRASFFRQLKRLTGLTPAQYLDEARFQKARRLLENREVSSVKSAAYAVGFRQVKHFSQSYKKRFGKLPSE